MKRIVIKIGTSNLCDGRVINKERIAKIAQCISCLKKQFEVILVTSGAVASGYTQIQLDITDLANKRVLASIGQPLLLEIYHQAFAKYGITIAQILLSQCDFDSKKSTQNAKDTVETLLANGVLPIINENDAVAAPELKIGDNDSLSAYSAYYFDAELLVILSDVDGYFDKDPYKYQDALLFKEIHQISQQELQASYVPHGHFATGGIVTKLIAANFLIQRGKKMFLCNGEKLQELQDFLLKNQYVSGTLFVGKCK